MSVSRTLSRSGTARAARRRIRRLSDASVEVTSSLRLEPDFLIVGAQRSGTTTLFKTLTQHPMVVRPFLRKGVHYFDKRYDRGAGWYRGHFPLATIARLRRFGRGDPRTGESSPYYMFHPLAPARIAQDLADARLLVLLRDPVERAHSAHSHELARGFESEPFQRAIELEPERLAGERERMLSEPGYESMHWQHNAYLTRGQYVEQLEHLESVVGRDRLLVLDSFAFFTEPAASFEVVCSFLGLPHVDGVVFERHNARSRSSMEPALRQRLEEHFAPYDERLARWWGREPSWRR